MPDWSIVIPVYREREIQYCVDRVRKIAADRDIEIVISGSDDGWSAGRILRPGKGLFVVDAQRGRGLQVAEALRAVNAPKVLVLHADTDLPPHAFDLMDRVLEKRDVGAFRLRMRTKNPILAISALNVNIRSTFTRIPFGDQAHFFRRKILAEIGGYPAIPLFEDVDFMERLKRRHIPIDFVPRAVVTSDRRYRALGYWRTTLRNWKLEIDWKKGVGADELAVRYRKGAAPKREREKNAIIVFHRALRLGFVKTRIANTIGNEATLSLYRAFLTDLEKNVLETDAAILPFVDCTGDPDALFWPSASVQSGADLGQRMATSIQDAIDRGFEKVVLIGSDVPHLRKRELDAAFRLLSERDVSFGPATDGGYYLVGVNAAKFNPAIFALSAWSHNAVLHESLSLCAKAGLSVGLCGPMTDFDGVTDIETWFRSSGSKKSASATWYEWKKIRSLIQAN